MKSNLLVNSESYHISKVAWLKHNNLLIILIPGNNVERVLDKLKQAEKKMVSTADNDATEQIINVWSFMIMPWAISVNIKWQKKKKTGQKYICYFSLSRVACLYSEQK